jgi:hypothetical protein
MIIMTIQLAEAMDGSGFVRIGRNCFSFFSLFAGVYSEEGGISMKGDENANAFYGQEETRTPQRKMCKMDRGIDMSSCFF